MRKTPNINLWAPSTPSLSLSFGAMLPWEKHTLKTEPRSDVKIFSRKLKSQGKNVLNGRNHNLEHVLGHHRLFPESFMKDRTVDSETVTST